MLNHMVYLLLESKNVGNLNPEGGIKMQRFIAPLSSKGQVTVPKKVRELLHLDHKGDLIGFEPRKGGVLMRKYVVHQSEEEFSEEEWAKLKKMADQKGKVYADAKEFLKDLRKL